MPLLRNLLGLAAKTASVLLLAGAGLWAGAPAARAEALVELTRVGNPLWTPTDFHLFSAELGPPPDFPKFFETAFALFPPPNHQPHPQLGVGPGAPHGPPYDTELQQGLARLGIVDKTVFSVAEFSNERAVWLVWMNVPIPGLAPTGSSPDFASGPIIPNTIFPITPFNGGLFRNGEPYDLGFGGGVPPLNDPSLTPSFNVEGQSHFPSFAASGTVFGPPGVDPVGNYEYRFRARDAGGNGWDVTARFQVVLAVPGPAGLTLLGTGLLGLLGAGWRRAWAISGFLP